MITGRMLTGNFIYVFGACLPEERPTVPDASTAKFAKKRQKIIKEFEQHARQVRMKGQLAYGAIYNFPSEGMARQWLGSKTLPAAADMTLTATPLGRAKVARR